MKGERKKPVAGPTTKREGRTNEQAGKSGTRLSLAKGGGKKKGVLRQKRSQENVEKKKQMERAKKFENKRNQLNQEKESVGVTSH